MLVLRNEAAILRDLVEADIADHIRWETTETEWKLWDAPWEHEGKTEGERAAELAEDVERMHGWARSNVSLLDADRRTKFEVCLADSCDPLAATHVGSCATYQIDDAFNIVDGAPHCARHRHQRGFRPQQGVRNGGAATSDCLPIRAGGARGLLSDVVGQRSDDRPCREAGLS